MSVRPRVLRLLERGHSWVSDEDGDEYYCKDCGRTIYIFTHKTTTGEVIEDLRKKVHQIVPCDMEKVRQVMES